MALACLCATKITKVGIYPNMIPWFPSSQWIKRGNLGPCGLMSLVGETCMEISCGDGSTGAGKSEKLLSNSKFLMWLSTSCNCTRSYDQCEKLPSQLHDVETCRNLQSIWRRLHICIRRFPYEINTSRLYADVSGHWPRQCGKWHSVPVCVSALGKNLSNILLQHAVDDKPAQRKDDSLSTLARHWPPTGIPVLITDHLEMSLTQITV